MLCLTTILQEILPLNFFNECISIPDLWGLLTFWAKMCPFMALCVIFCLRYGCPFYLWRSHQRRAPQVNKSFFSSSFSFSNYQILAYNAYFRLYQDHPGVPCDFPGNLASREIWLPGNLTSRKFDFLGNLTPRKSVTKEMWHSKKCDFLENVMSRKLWLPGK